MTDMKYEDIYGLLLKLAEMVEDKFELYDLLATEAGNGNDTALDLMDAIWPPEQIMEED